MPQTYSTQAIVLNRRPIKEADSRVSLYTLDYGRLDLLVKGARKLSSKLSGHVEPFNLLEVMVISGRQAYAGGTLSRNCYLGIKSDFDKLEAAGYAFNRFNKLIKEGVSDETLFYLLSDFLALLDHVSAEAAWYRWLSQLFLCKALHHLGFGFNASPTADAEIISFLTKLSDMPLYEAAKRTWPRSKLQRASRIAGHWIEAVTER